ncbi:DnaJ family domain-containing protein [Streptomyces radiopugnans]|uniref:DnaJ family domain-containing protein n=1 Tax=Streptomyces radiopugnans TaxID=403935 RepID=UPI003F1A1843
MTERKPPGVDFETWADRQIREAAERGEFDELPGMGRPLPDLDQPYDDLWWVRRKMSREGLSYLPPALALRKEAEDALAAARRARSEPEVRRIVAGINERIRAALRMPPPGPPLGLEPLDAEEVVRQWREGPGEREGQGKPDERGDGGRRPA